MEKQTALKNIFFSPKILMSKHRLFGIRKSPNRDIHLTPKIGFFETVRRCRLHKNLSKSILFCSEFPTYAHILSALFWYEISYSFRKVWV